MIDITTLLLTNCPTYEEGGRFLKTQFLDNKERFMQNFIYEMHQRLCMNGFKNANKIRDFYINLYESSKPYTFREAFNIKDTTFRAKVFSVINVPEMIAKLGSTRIKTDGIELINNVYDPISNTFKKIPFTQIYELHEVNIEKLLSDDTLERGGNIEKGYAIKCWCTSTDKEHWLFTLENKSPKRAIASTCMVYKPMLGKIGAIIRQGDVFLFEMTEEVDIKETDEIVPLSEKDYFNLLKSQS